MNMKFASRIKPNKTKGVPTGSKFKNTYEEQLNDHNHKSLVKTGKTNLYETVQKHAEDTKISNILERATLGDKTALNRMQGQYVDCTDLPKSLMEAQNEIVKVKSQFETLPVEIREKFNFSPEQYVSEFGSKTWADKTGITKAREDYNRIITEQKAKTETQNPTKEEVKTE